MHTTAFGPSTTAKQAIAGLDLRGIRAVITGASSGIGAETARALASAGAAVTLAVRNSRDGDEVAADINASYGEGAATVAILELADVAAVRAFAAAWSGPLHLLINNAGVMALPNRSLNNAGHELHFATNHLGHFVLAEALHDALSAGARQPVAADGLLGGARIVSLSSRGHLRANVDFDDVDFSRRPYDPMIAYGQSKTANVLFAVEAARKWGDDGITANAVHPGAILETNLSRHMPQELLSAVGAANKQGFKTIAQGAATSIVAATSPDLAGIGGRYFEDCQEAEVIGPSVPDLSSHASGVAWYALDATAARRLWELSSRLTT